MIYIHSYIYTHTRQTSSCVTEILEPSSLREGICEALAFPDLSLWCVLESMAMLRHWCEDYVAVALKLWWGMLECIARLRHSLWMVRISLRTKKIQDSSKCLPCSNMSNLHVRFPQNFMHASLSWGQRGNDRHALVLKNYHNVNFAHILACTHVRKSGHPCILFVHDGQSVQTLLTPPPRRNGYTNSSLRIILCNGRDLVI